MTETIKEKLAEAEFWAMEAKNYYDTDEEQYGLLQMAHDLIKQAIAIEAKKEA